MKIFKKFHSKQPKLKNTVIASLTMALLCTSAVYGGNYKMGNYDITGSRAIPSKQEPSLSRKNVLSGEFEVKWFTALDGWVAAPVAVVDGLAFVGTMTYFLGQSPYIPGNLISAGSIYALDSTKGNIVWQHSLPGGVLASPLIDGKDLYVQSYDGTLTKFDYATGAVEWTTKPNLNGDPMDSTWSGLIKAGNIIVATINPNDELVNFPAGKGAIYGIDPASGNILWETITNPHPGEGGPSSWAISPSYSANLGLIFITLSNTTHPPVDAQGQPILPPYAWGQLSSDTVMALSKADGHIVWSTQVGKNDYWNFNIPWDPKNPRDTDIGDGAHLFSIKNKEYVAFGTKRGYFYVLEAATGNIINLNNNAYGCTDDFKCGLDAFNGPASDGQIGNGIDGGYTLNSGYYTTKGGVIHFSVLNDYKDNLGKVARGESPYDGLHGAPFGTCGSVPLGFTGPDCPEINNGVLVLNNQNGTMELGRFNVPEKHLHTPIYLDGLIYLHATPNESVAGPLVDSMIVLDVTDPAHIVKVSETPIDFNGYAASSGGSTITIGQGTIFVGSGFFDFTTEGVFALGLK